MLKMLSFFYIITFWTSWASAAPTSIGQHWQQLLHQKILWAQDPHQLQQLVEKQKQGQVLSAACDLQLNRRQIPMACYELRALLPAQDEKLTSEDLEQACLRAADNFRGVQLDSRYIESAKCRNKLGQKILLNRYKNGR